MSILVGDLEKQVMKITNLIQGNNLTSNWRVFILFLPLNLRRNNTIRLVHSYCRLTERGWKLLERIFSVEIESKDHISVLTLSDESKGQVLFEGNLGFLSEVEVYDDVIELVGSNGVLRFSLTCDELKKIAAKSCG